MIKTQYSLSALYSSELERKKTQLINSWKIKSAGTLSNMQQWARRPCSSASSLFAIFALPTSSRLSQPAGRRTYRAWEAVSQVKGASASSARVVKYRIANDKEGSLVALSLLPPRPAAVACSATSNNTINKHPGRRKGSPAAVFSRLLRYVLPSGYPESVHSSYAHYARCQFVAMVCSSAAGVMSTQALLLAMGLGAASAPMAAAALNWVIKDGVGQLGGVLFSSLVSTRFDASPKVWRMVAAFCLDVSTIIELLSPLATSHFLLIASLANVGKNVSFLAASASRAAIHYSFAKRENLADVTAKAGAQAMLAATLGTGAGIGFSHFIGSDWNSMMPIAAVLCAGHLALTYWSLKPVASLTLDMQRLEIAAAAHMTLGRVPRPAEVASDETMAAFHLRQWLGWSYGPGVVVGAPLTAAVTTAAELESAISTSLQLGGLRHKISPPKCILCVRESLGKERRAAIFLLLAEDCEPRDVLGGAYRALQVRNMLNRQGYGPWVHATALGGGKLLNSDIFPGMESFFDEADVEDFCMQVESCGWHTKVNYFEHEPKTRLRFHLRQPVTTDCRQL
jgi:hypothetical protein